MKENEIQEVVQKIIARFPDQVESAEMLYDFMTITIKREVILDLMRFLYNDPELKFTFLTTLCGLHFPLAEPEKQMGMMYQVHNLEQNLRLRIKFFFPDDETIEIPSLTPIFKAANWMERETYDFFGFRFAGHPDLRRILNVDEMVMFPLRKEYPLEDQTREDKDDTMFGR